LGYSAGPPAPAPWPSDSPVGRPEQVEISVRDQGIGIPLERRGQLFERFYQAHAGNYMSGLGLGLYVSRQLVELHAGELLAEFPADGGTRFVVRLPTVAGVEAVSAAQVQRLQGDGSYV
jgi:signal transduction histidine kinase